MVAAEETNRSQFFSFLAQNSSAIDGNSSSAQSKGARRSALGVENFPHRKVDFMKDIAKSLRITSDKRNVQRNDVQALGRRK